MPRWRIGIDCRLAGLSHAGIGRYSAELVTELLHLGVTDKIQWVLFCSDEAQVDTLLHDAPAGASTEIVLTPIRQYTVAEQVLLPRQFRASKLDLLHVPHFNVPLLYRDPFVITIHDLLWHEQRGAAVTTLSASMYWLKYCGYRIVTSQAIARAKHIFVPTKHVAESVKSWYPQAEEKLQVTIEGASTNLTAPKQKRDAKHLLYVGSLYPHKNIQVVLKALKQLPDWQLQIVGSRSIFLEQTESLVADLGIQSQVTFSGRLSDTALATAYRTCTALIQPSHSEGFGLTGLEAIALGAPVIASDIPVFHEVYQDAAIYFDQNSPEALIGLLQAFDTHAQQYDEKTQQKVLAQYSWKRMAKQTYSSYLNVLKQA